MESCATDMIELEPIHAGSMTAVLVGLAAVPGRFGGSVGTTRQCSGFVSHCNASSVAGRPQPFEEGR
jgi:hypothetical protein